jgi:hypothetical protein
VRRRAATACAQWRRCQPSVCPRNCFMTFPRKFCTQHLTNFCYAFRIMLLVFLVLNVAWFFKAIVLRLLQWRNFPRIAFYKKNANIFRNNKNSFARSDFG